jgi:hypothetical protein
MSDEVMFGHLAPLASGAREITRIRGGTIALPLFSFGTCFAA